MPEHSNKNPTSLPAHLAASQSQWLAPARARLLRRAGIANRKCVLDLGAGTGAVTEELVRRSGGTVLALDLDMAVLRAKSDNFDGARRVCANALALPCADAAFDMVFTQFVLLWLDAERAVDEIARVLAPGGVLVAIEPDYGGLIEYPPEIGTRELWLAGLARAGAEPRIGRRLPYLLEQSGFDVRVDLHDRLLPPAVERFELLRGLLLDATESERLAAIETADGHLDEGWGRIAHLPCMLISATRSEAS